MDRAFVSASSDLKSQVVYSAGPTSQSSSACVVCNLNQSYVCSLSPVYMG